MDILEPKNTITDIEISVDRFNRSDNKGCISELIYMLVEHRHKLKFLKFYPIHKLMLGYNKFIHAGRKYEIHELEAKVFIMQGFTLTCSCTVHRCFCTVIKVEECNKECRAHKLKNIYYVGLEVELGHL